MAEKLEADKSPTIVQLNGFAPWCVKNLNDLHEGNALKQTIKFSTINLLKINKKYSPFLDIY